MFRKRVKSFLPLILACFWMGSISAGCAVLAAGGGGAVGAGGTYAYIRGELKRTYHIGYDRAWTATNRAVKELQLKVDETSKDAFSAEMKGALADGEKFSIILKPEGSELVTVGVRIGLIGDEEKSLRIHQAISNGFQTRTSQKSG